MDWRAGLRVSHGHNGHNGQERSVAVSLRAPPPVDQFPGEKTSGYVTVTMPSGGGGNVMGGDGLRESVGVIVEQASSVL